MSTAMPRSRRSFLLSLLSVGLVGAPNIARGCAFDGIFDGSFGYIHPRAIDVALAVRDAAASGILPDAALAPLTPGAAGLWEAVSILEDAGARMSQARPPGSPSANIALLLSESSLWTRYVSTPRGFEALIHADGPAGSDIVLITDLSVLKALREARLSVSTALARALTFLESGDGGASVERLLRAAYEEDGATAATDVAARLPWRRSRLP